MLIMRTSARLPDRSGSLIVDVNGHHGINNALLCMAETPPSPDGEPRLNGRCLRISIPRPDHHQILHPDGKPDLFSQPLPFSMTNIGLLCEVHVPLRTLTLQRVTLSLPLEIRRNLGSVFRHAKFARSRLNRGKACCLLIDQHG